LGELGDRRRLANAVHADEEPNRHQTRLGDLAHRAVRRQRVEQEAPHRGRDTLGRAVRAQLVEHDVGRHDTDVAAQQDLLDHVELRGVDHARPGERPHAFEHAPRRGQPLVERRPLGQVLDQHLGHGRARANRDGRRAPTTNDDEGREREYRDANEDVGESHAGSASRTRFTRWLTTLEEAPGPIVTP
jgi:hypothetical protein